MNAKFTAILESMPTRSAWQRGVKAYAAGLLQTMDENGIDAPTETDMLNGADDWNQWAWGGCGEIYDADIAERLCSPSELRKTHNGERRPNAREEWLDVEARAAGQAAHAILRAIAKGNAQ